MADDYLKEKSLKKKSVGKFVWVIVFLGAAFVFLLGKYALSGDGSSFSGLPGSDNAYTVAKSFISPTVLSTNLKFSDDEYKFAKKSDSVYVIKSFYTAKDNNGETKKTNFTITLKYNGGHAEEQKNWDMVNLNQD